MTTEIITLPNGTSDAARLEDANVRAARVAPDILVDHFRGPLGGHGFRKGHWTVTFRGADYRVYTSVPHACDLDEQARMVRTAAARALIFAGLA